MEERSRQKKFTSSQLVYVLQSLTSVYEPQAITSFYKLVASLLQAVHKPAESLASLC